MSVSVSLPVSDPTPCAACPLRRFPVFKTNTREEIAFVQAMRLDQIDVPARGSIIEEGEKNPSFYAIFSGWAFRYQTLGGDRRQILNFLLPGDVVGFQAQMLGDATHGVEALTPVRLCRHPRPMVWNLYETHPQLAFDATWLTAKEESLVDEMLLALGRRSATERVAMLMAYLFRRARSVDPAPGDTVSLPLTQQHIADALGLSLVHTNKTLRRLQKQKYFRFERQRLQVFDLPGLERLGDCSFCRLEQRPLL